MIGSTTTNQYTVYAAHGIRLLGGPISGDLMIASNLIVGTGTAVGTYAVAEGYQTTASGDYSHAEGQNTTASGYYSHAEGEDAKATNDHTYVWNDGTNVDGDGYCKSTTNNQFSVYAANGIRLYGTVYHNGSAVHTSDRRLKQNIQPIQNALDKVDQINGIYYEMIDRPEVTEVGVIAQEIEAVLPEVVVENPEGYKSVDYSKLTALLIEAVKELKAENQEKDAKIEMLREEKEVEMQALRTELIQRLEVLERKIVALERTPILCIDVPFTWIRENSLA